MQFILWSFTVAGFPTPTPQPSGAKLGFLSKANLVYQLPCLYLETIEVLGKLKLLQIYTLRPLSGKAPSNSISFIAKPTFTDHCLIHDLTLVCTVNLTLSFSLRASGISIWREGSTFRSTDTDLSCNRIHRISLGQASSRFSKARLVISCQQEPHYAKRLPPGKAHMDKHNSLDTTCTSLWQAFPSKHRKLKRLVSLKSGEPIIRVHTRGIWEVFSWKKHPPSSTSPACLLEAHQAKAYHTI